MTTQKSICLICKRDMSTWRSLVGHLVIDHYLVRKEATILAGPMPLRTEDLAKLLPRVPTSWSDIRRLTTWTPPEVWRQGEVATSTGIFSLLERQAGFFPRDLRQIQGAIRFYDTIQGGESRLRAGKGFILYDINQPLDAPYPQGVIIDIVVLARYQRRGIGRSLVELMEDRMDQYGVGRITGYALGGSEAFWLALGYSLANQLIRKELR